MGTAFKNHIIICGWNGRGRNVVRVLQVLSRRPLLIVHTDMEAVLKDLKQRDRVCFMIGDPSRPEVLKAAEVAHAHSVLVLSDDSLGIGTDARSVQIALAVERIRSAVYSVVEVKDLRNKAHFSRTKVDDIVSEQKVAVCLVAQGIRHLNANGGHGSEAEGRVSKKERELLKVYHQLLNPFQSRTQLYRLELSWQEASAYTFLKILQVGLTLGVCPVALVGYTRHEHRSTLLGRGGWVSWKTHSMSNPEPAKAIHELWEGWPGEEFPLGVLYLGTAGSSPEALAGELLQGLKKAGHDI